MDKVSGGWLTSQGYRAIMVNNVEVREHRYIMEQHLSRKLRTDEIIHHINEIRDDNRLENLQIVSRSGHIKIHHCGKYVSDETKLKLSRVISGKNHPNYGKHLTEETKAKIAKTNQGQKRSDKTKINISKSLMGRKQSEFTIKKRLVSRSWYKPSEETKLKISASSKLTHWKKKFIKDLVSEVTENIKNNTGVFT